MKQTLQQVRQVMAMAKKKNTVDYRGSQVQNLIEWANAWVNKSSFPHANNRNDMWNAADSCQAFVASAYYAAGVNPVYTSLNYAADARRSWGKNNLTWKNGKIDCSKIPLGACIYSQCGNDTRGHVSLYIGSGYIIEAGVNPIRKILLNNTLSGRKYYSWGFNGNQQPQGSAVQKTTETKRYLGKFDVTAYCSCKICCGEYSPEVTGKPAKTSSGTTPKANHTVAVDPDVITMGSKLIIDGKTYYAEDTGGAIKGKRIDIYYGSHKAALNSGYGHKMCDVYIIEGDGTYSDNSSGISFNLEKKSTASIPDFNKAEKVKLMGLDKNKGLTLKIIHENAIYDVTELCYDSIQLVTKRKANPGKLTFKIARDLIPAGGVEFYEGDAVALMYDDIGMFWGYIFSKSRTKEQIIAVTAYDQTRYLKNKETYCYSKTASEVVKMICEDFNLQMGEIADTGYTINERIEDNSTLWDTIYNAIDFTNIYTGRYYELYDDFGDITLKPVDENRLPIALVSDDNTLIDFSYKTDIDTNTYNRVVLYRDNEDTGTREVYEAQDTVNEMKWGVLQYTEKVSEGYTEGQIQDLCDRFIKMYNKVNRTFSVEDKGNPNVRAGCGIWVQIDDVGEAINVGAMVESCTHTFKNGEHTMKLEITCEEAIE